MGNKFSFLEQTEDVKQLTLKKQPKKSRKQKGRALEAVPSSEEKRPIGRPRTGKRSNPDYRSLTILARKDLHESIKEILRKDPDGLDISGLFEKLCSEWLDDRGAKRLKVVG